MITLSFPFQAESSLSYHMFLLFFIILFLQYIVADVEVVVYAMFYHLVDVNDILRSCFIN